MKRIETIRGARTIVETCAGVKAGESVLIITDTNMVNIAEVLAMAVKERDAEPILAVMIPRKGHSEEPPACLAEAMKEADVVLTPVSTSITHTRAMKEAAAAGSRAIVMTAFTEDLLIRGGIQADFRKQKPICLEVARRFQEAKTARLTSPAGTSLSMRKEGRKGNALFCLVERGEFSTVPTIEANFSPLEGTAEGLIVADASIPYLGIGVLKEPVKCRVKKGFIVEIEGGYQAEILKRDLESRKDPNSYNIAELGLGLNPESRMTGVMLDDEGVLGSVHIGIGSNITLGGNIKAAIHYDLLMWGATLELDGRVILDKGELKI
ncbi:MAG: leucyl aminopeptidase [Syntrophaceae bacterium]|nr:leucyl aminopeptidase [Syntrophaceae bacterium]